MTELVTTQTPGDLDSHVGLGEELKVKNKTLVSFRELKLKVHSKRAFAFHDNCHEVVEQMTAFRTNRYLNSATIAEKCTST